LSLVINDFKIIKNDKEIKRLLYSLDINTDEIEKLIKKGFKLS